jgi:hypothetical protein
MERERQRDEKSRAADHLIQAHRTGVFDRIDLGGVR